jgi:hypothetical protein
VSGHAVAVVVGETRDVAAEHVTGSSTAQHLHDDVVVLETVVGVGAAEQGVGRCPAKWPFYIWTTIFKMLLDAGSNAGSTSKRRQGMYNKKLDIAIGKLKVDIGYPGDMPAFFLMSSRPISVRYRSSRFVRTLLKTQIKCNKSYVYNKKTNGFLIKYACMHLFFGRIHKVQTRTVHISLILLESTLKLLS